MAEPAGQGPGGGRRERAGFGCPACGRRYRWGDTAWRCACGSALDYLGRPEPGAFAPERLAAAGPTLWRYAGALPPLDPDAVTSLGEAMTPLVRVTGPLAGDLRLYHKVDYCLPTGSFKDRGTAVMISYLHQQGVTEVVEDSSGNAGASTAAYAARAGMACTILVPRGASGPKLSQIAATGARVVEVPGTREDTARAALAAAERVTYAGHNWQPLFIEGVKTVAFEIWEQLGRRAPDALVVPLGYGSLVLGAFAGFGQLLQAGLVTRLPRLLGVQAAACAPVAAALAAGLADVPAVQGGPTAAEGVACRRPVRGRALLDAVRRSGGWVTTVSEGDIQAARQRLARAGWYVEPTGAVASAGLGALAAEGRLAPGETVVVVLTGSGLKTR